MWQMFKEIENLCFDFYGSWSSDYDETEHDIQAAFAIAS